MKQLLCLMFAVVLVCNGIAFALSPILIGNFEDGPDTGFTPWRYDTWFDDGLAMVDDTDHGVTRGTHSLKGSTDAGGWGPGIQFPLFGDNQDALIAAVTAPNAVVAVDATAYAEDIIATWCDIGFTRNTAAPTNGWDKSGWQPMLLDGIPHRYTFTVTEATKTAILEAIGGWGANIGLCIQTGEGSAATVYFDNIWIFPEGDGPEDMPYAPYVTQAFAANPNFVDLDLHWKAAADPNEIYAVNPDIVDEYVFM